MMTIINGLAAMEAMVVGAKAGLDLERLLEVVEAGTGSSYSLNVIRYVIFRGNFDPAKFALSWRPRICGLQWSMPARSVWT